MSNIYGKSWSKTRKCMTESWAEESTRQLHDSRLPYTVFVEQMNRPSFFAEFINDCVNVRILDKLGREYVSYQFQEMEPERLFLTMAVHREFEAETSQVVRGTTFLFKPDGSVILEEEDFVARTKTSGPATNPVDVSLNWEPYPKFGDYTSIGRVDRESKPSQS